MSELKHIEVLVNKWQGKTFHAWGGFSYDNSNRQRCRSCHGDIFHRLTAEYNAGIDDVTIRIRCVHCDNSFARRDMHIKEVEKT